MSTENSQNFLADWDIVTFNDATKLIHLATNVSHPIKNTFFSKIEKIMNKAFHKSNNNSEKVKKASPLGEKQFSNYLDFEGRIKSMRELRLTSYRRGVAPKLRRAVWKHLLNVFPLGLTGQQRYEYVRAKSILYNELKSTWQAHFTDPTVDYIYHMVKKDVLRTDRSHSFYASSGDENPNVISLLNILTTFALNHKVKYCQGMSDLASPLLYAMKEESHAYICFCALMTRLSENFSSNGEAIIQKFENLSTLLQYYDPDFYLYLKKNGVEDLPFCYRWILLELKREFAFDDTLYMLEVLWSSIPPPIEIDDLLLFDPDCKFIAGQYSLQSNLECHLTNKPLCVNNISTNHNNSNHNFKQYYTSKVNNYNSPSNSDTLITQQHFTFNLIEINSKFKYPNLKDSNSIKIQKFDSERKNSHWNRSMSIKQPPQFNSLPNSNKTSYPLALKLFPKLFNSDSDDNDSLETEIYFESFSFPPRQIEKRFSTDDEEDDHNQTLNEIKQRFTSKIKCEKKFKSKIKEKKNKSSFENRDHLNRFKTETLDNDELVLDTSKNPCIPQSLARSSSLDSIKDLKIQNNEEINSSMLSQLQTFEKEKSEGYESGSTSEVHFNLHDNKSNSSSCSSLVMLSAEAIPGFKKVPTLPSPTQLGYNNAFMLFLCLTLLLQHRDKIMSSKLDSNEIGVYFDSFLRRHDVHTVLNYARHLFYFYLSHWHQNKSEEDLQTFYNSLDLV